MTSHTYITDVLELKVASLLAREKPKKIAIPNFRFTRKYEYIISDIKKRRKKYKIFIILFCVVLHIEHYCQTEGALD